MVAIFVYSLERGEETEHYKIKQPIRQKSPLLLRPNLVPRVFSLSNKAAAGEKTLAHSELKRSLIGAFHCAFIRALSLVYSFQNKEVYPLRAS